MHLYEELKARGLVFQATESGVAEALAKSLTAYIGFDPTAPSLHVGSLLPVTMLMRLQRAGHTPIAIVGGGTGMVGDPSGKSSERPFLDEERLARNLAGLRGQLERYLDFTGSNAAVMVDNREWLGKVSLIEFLRDVGKHASVNAMIARDSVKRRLEEREHGISYTEFSYMLLQAYDYLEVYDRYGCTLQCGGSDQWGNIVSGRDLVRRMRGGDVHGLTFPLLMRSDGKKFGKSEAGNIWIDPDLTTPYELYQYFVNAPDADVGKLLRQFTFVSLDDIAEVEREVEANASARAGQRRLAEEMTRLVHGQDAVERAERTTRVLFGGGDLGELSAAELKAAFRGTPATAVSAADLAEGVLLVDALARTKLCASKGEARRMVKSGAVSINHFRDDNLERVLGRSDVLDGVCIVLKRGKKTYHVLSVEED